jgi:hypothetical protein
VPRSCTVCTHDENHAINVALVHRELYRSIAKRFSVSAAAVQRHSRDHIPQLLVKASAALEAANADDLLAQVQDLQARTLAILDAAETSHEHRTGLSAIREARGNLELLAKLLGELDERTQVNVHVHPQWLELRAVVVAALGAHPQARDAVLRALESMGDSTASQG